MDTKQLAMMIVFSHIQVGCFVVPVLVGIVLVSDQGKSWYTCTVVKACKGFVTLQHLLLLARCIHQSMPIMVTLLLELRVLVPTV